MPNDKKTFVEAVNINFTKSNGKFTHEEIRTGCIQSIARDVKKIAQDRVDLERERDWYKAMYREKVDEVTMLRHRNRGLKSAYSRLKNKINKNAG